ncbi:MAG TPA: cellulase family glycosylhydrolase [Bryobacteraceae bacterium]
MPLIPARRGFNLTELVSGSRPARFFESDFEWMAEWGFDFARLPLSYWYWTKPAGDWLAIEPAQFAPVDEAIRWGRRYGVHVNLCLHRIPGYCINEGPGEPFQLFSGPTDGRKKALEAAVHHWGYIAERYKEHPSSELSFDLLNEPPRMKDRSQYVEVIRALVAAIREKDSDRVIYVDGADLGQTPLPEVVDLDVVQSTRGYLPKSVSHHTAAWVPKDEFETFGPLTWPLIDDFGRLWNRDLLHDELIQKWKRISDAGVSIHVGEWGCHNAAPHWIALAWMSDLLALWNEAGWGWALWNLRGSFGVVDSGRADVRYAPFRGHQLDRSMLDLLRENLSDSTRRSTM